MRTNHNLSITLGLLAATGLLSSLPVYATKNITESPGVSSATLQSDLNSISAAGGGTLTLNAGTYNITQTLELTSNTKIHGVGQTSVTLVGPSSQYSWPIIEINGTALNGNTVEQLTVNGNITGNWANNVGNYANACGFHGFSTPFAGSGWLNINNCTFHNCGEGIAIGDLEYITLANDTISLCGVALSSGLYNHDSYLNSCEDVTVSDCNFSSSWRGNGLHLNNGGSYGPNFTVENSTFSSNGSDGISMGANSGTASSNVTIEYNTCSNNGFASNVTAGSDGGCGILGDCTTGGLITHNTDDGNNSYGIKTGAGVWTVTYNTDENNYYTILGLWGTITKSNNTGDQ